MSDTDTFTIPLEAAETYEARFVPALFAEWAPILVERAGVAAGQSVLDVACGTGVVARAAAERAGPAGRVVGLDRLEAMLTVARRVRPDLEWRQGDAAALPFPDASFDVVLSQAALMFFPDPRAALAEMARVARPGGRAGLQVWGRLEASPGLAPFAAAVGRHAGPEAVRLWSTYFRHGDREELAGLVESVGLRVEAADSRLGTIRLGSIDEYVAVEVASTPLAGLLDEGTYDRILADARRDLAQFATADGVALPIEGHLLVARRS